MARRERALFEEHADYQALADKGDHDRRELLLNVGSRGLVAVLVAATAMLIVAAVVFVWHYIAPSQFRFLDEAQRNELKDLVFYSGIGALVAQAWQGLTRRRTSTTD